MAADQAQPARAMKPDVPQVPAGEMLKLLDELAAYSAPGPGVTRLLYTPEWQGVQLFLQERMAGLGLEVRMDQVGNIYGTLAGSQVSDKVILTGSHIDTVVNGGRYDGAYGVAAAVTALHYLLETFGRPLRTLEVVSFCEEEGSRFPLTFWGSGNVTGLYNGKECIDCADADGITLAAAMAACGLGESEGLAAEAAAGLEQSGGSGSGEPEAGATAGLQESCWHSNSPVRSDIAAYVELHIEQGIILERTSRRIGVVQAIAGQRRYLVKVGGTANHAGTTPMGLRQDALAGSAEMLLALERSALAEGDPLVATTGRLEVYPGTSNVIPGEVQFTLDIRHSEAGVLERFCAAILAEFAELGLRRGLTLEVQPLLVTAPAPMDLELRAALEEICLQQEKPYLSMVSGAGHDAQLFAPRCPAAMIFVPSQGGISHSPGEYTSPEELAAGLEVLTAILYRLAYE
ncbi:Zn-dependent hydrolase [Paenibacillus sp. FSL R7-0337]|uniref:Zn-dependent hydrolase n=1 Tax=Paenibacillus sp. FSL R7-0337 TaxID=1926588 RepID=UPI0021166605|nr:Zn-dependent hydrolase [Paenibacillus sp. FSL R7-0337]